MTKKVKTKPSNYEIEIKELVQDIVHEEVSKLDKPKQNSTYDQWLLAKETDDPRKIAKAFRKLTENWLATADENKIKEIWATVEPIYTDKDILQTSERQNLYKIQERLFGKLDLTKKSKLERLGKTLTTQEEKLVKNIKYNLPPAGTIINKEWNGNRLQVKIVEGGFEYKDKIYKSLSGLARKISGYGVSGPIFFGLRKRPQ